MPSRSHFPDIEVHIPFSLSLARGILEGVNRFRAEHGELAVRIFDHGGQPPGVRHCRAILFFNPGILSNSLGKEVRATVNLSNRTDQPPSHSVLNDDYEVGRTAADHFIDRSFRSFAFLKLGTIHFSTVRFTGFRDRIRERLGNPTYEVTSLEDGEQADPLFGLAKPCGILAANDHAAARIVDTALDAGFRVPEDLAVLGVDDDPVRCAMSRVELSSVRLNSVAQGYEAMVLAVELLRKRRPPPRVIVRLIPPLGVTTRRSTETFAHHHPGVAAVLGVLRDRVHLIDGVDALARACGMGPRTLERLFKEQLQSSPRAELIASRFRLARNLLVQSTRSINEVAEKAGYADVRTLICQCKRQTGLTPMALRKRHTLQ